MNGGARVLIVDDHVMLRESMRVAVDYDHLPADGIDVFFLGWHQPEVAVLSGQGYTASLASATRISIVDNDGPLR